MKEFMLAFRRDVSTDASQFSPEQYQDLAKQWKDWMESLVAQKKFSGPGKRMSHEGAVVHADKTITNGPYVDVKEGLAGYAFVFADNIEEAAELAKGCPILGMGGSVEIRPIVPEGHN